MTEFTKAQLATILGALDDKPRNPSDKDAALKAIAKAGTRFGLTVEDILGVAPGLLDGRMTPAAFRAELQEVAGPRNTEPTIKLTDAQLVVLAEASRRDDGSILPLPKSIKADATDRMVNALMRKGLVERIVCDHVQDRGKSFFLDNVRLIAGRGNGQTMINRFFVLSNNPNWRAHHPAIVAQINNIN